MTESGEKLKKQPKNIIFWSRKPYDYSIQQSSVKDEQVLIGGKIWLGQNFPRKYIAWMERTAF